WLENGIPNVDWWTLANSTTGQEFRNATQKLANGSQDPNSPFVGANFDPNLFPQSPPNDNVTFGDFGLLSDGACDQFALPGHPKACPKLLNGTTLGTQLASGTPQPTYFGYKMLSNLGKPGDTMVLAGTPSSNLVSIHAVKQANGSLAVLVINKDP